MDNVLKKKVESYRKGEDKRPLIIDFSNIEELSDFKNSYLSLPSKNVFDICSGEDVFPTLANLYEFLDTCVEKECILFSLGTMLKIYGKGELESCIHALLNKSFFTKFIIATYQCGNYIKETSPRTKENIIVSDHPNYSFIPTLVFIDKKYEDKINDSVSLKTAMIKFEKCNGGNIYISSKYSKSIFPYAMIPIEDCRSPYDVLCLKDNRAKELLRDYGRGDEWAYLLNHLDNDSLEITIRNRIRCNDILAEIKEWNDKSNFDRWLIFLYLKLTSRNTGNWSVDFASKNSGNTKDFLKALYNSIASLNYKDPDFWTKYKERKSILKSINDGSEIFAFCSFIRYKKHEALYYLTDNTDFEKNTIIEIIDAYKEKYTKDQLMNVLANVYHDLYDYLCFYNYGNSLLNSYFDQYKYLKTINYLSSEFKNLVDKEAKERNFKRILMHRTEKLDELKVDGSVVYFIDALGAEFCSFIEKRCKERGLQSRINICQANLPTLTNKNTEFREYFSKKGVMLKDEKRLDNLIHDGKDQYDFDKNKLPIHLVEELNIINDCLDEIRKKIQTQSIKKAIIISDHGATRLAILNTEMVKEDVESIGEHGGRVCKYIEGMKEIPNAIIEGEYCVLCDYNSIKGGRVGKVEMHGGGTIEEVTVPIIEIVEKDNTVQVIINNTKLKTSYKKKPVLHFFVSKKLNSPSITIEGRKYEVKTQDNMNFESELEGINKAGNYTFDIWDGDDLISTGNNFSVEKEVGTSVDLWG